MIATTEEYGMATAECKSIYELARRVGVSYATVSRVLNGHPNVAPETRSAILEAAAAANFRPRLQARRLKIGFVVELEEHIAREQAGYLDVLTMVLINELSRHGVTLEVFTPYNLANLMPGQLDGLIAIPWSEAALDVLRQQRRVPVVLVNTKPCDWCSCVSCDHYESGKLAAEYLLNSGRRRCGLVLSAPDWGNLLRYEGFRDTLLAAGAEWEESRLGWLCKQSEIALFRQLLSQNVDGIFLGGESSLPEHIATIRLLGGAYPERLTLISMENRAISRFLDPPVSGIEQPLAEMMTQAVEVLLSQIQAPETPEHRLLRNQLIRRGAAMVQERG